MERSCPDCGADLEEALVVEERLDDLGYRHKDRTVECPECPWQGTFGHPVDPPTDEPPACAVCGGRGYPYKLDVHRWKEALYEPTDDLGSVSRLRVEELLSSIDVHWKCEACHYRWNGELEHLTADVYSLGVDHLEGRRDDA